MVQPHWQSKGLMLFDSPQLQPSHLKMETFCSTSVCWKRHQLDLREKTKMSNKLSLPFKVLLFQQRKYEEKENMTYTQVVTIQTKYKCHIKAGRMHHERNRNEKQLRVALCLGEISKAIERAAHTSQSARYVQKMISSLLSVLLLSLFQIALEKIKISMQKRIKIIQNSVAQRKVL